MSGLLQKDWYYIKEYGRAYVPLLVILCLVPGALGGSYALMLALALPRSTIASDEVRWNRLAVMLPIRVEETVRSKYLLYVPCILLGMVVTAVSLQTQQAVSALLRTQGVNFSMFSMGWLDSIEYALIMGALTAVIAALTVPLYYRFTALKGAMWANIIVILILQIAGTVCFNILYSTPPMGKVLVVGVMAALAAVLMVLSCQLSTRFYRKRLRGVYQ